MKLHLNYLTKKLSQIFCLILFLWTANSLQGLEIKKTTSAEGIIISAEIRYGLNKTDVCISGLAKKFINSPTLGRAHVDVQLWQDQRILVTKTAQLYSSLSKPVAFRMKRQTYKACFTFDELKQANQARITYHAHPHKRCYHEKNI